MRTGDFTCPSLEAFAPHMLTYTDISIDSQTCPTQMAVHLCQSKTDPFGAGVTLHLGRTGQALCPVTSMLSDLTRRPPTTGPLFFFDNGSTFSRQRLVQALHHALEASGISTKSFNGHSFRIGAATTASEVGLSDSTIQTLGRWKSAAFTSYIRKSQQSLAAVSTKLVSSSSTIS